ncbi:copper/zinc superoxide dismutase domain-containing protein [Ceratobasidium sp. AG-Ba]|nr:copper/zinc superoxide dismutase domain-containing protein [Ceratobasidium sp. AG-Ba]
MLFTSALLTLSVLSSVFAAPQHEDEGAVLDERGKQLYAQSVVANPALGIRLKFEFWGKKGHPTSVRISDITGLTNDPKLGGPFPYHIHTNPIPPNGDCTKALAHLDPLNLTEGFTCNPGDPKHCQTGDLSGKHGKFNGTASGKLSSVSYSDARVRFYPESHSLLGRSIVVHASNKTRLACGNITSYLDGTADWSFKPTYQPSNYVKDYPTVAPVQPSPPVVPSTGNKGPTPKEIEAFPYPFPYPALSIQEAPNVKLVSVTGPVKYNNTEQTVTRPKDVKSSAKPPF